MSDSPADRRHRVVHLASGARQGAAPVSAVIASSGLPCTEVFDAYAALALIARRGRDVSMTVVACLDELIEAELEFFQLLRREDPAVSVFTYANDRCGGLLARLQAEGTYSIDALAMHLARADDDDNDADPTRRGQPTRALRRLKRRDPSIASDASTSTPATPAPAPPATSAAPATPMSPSDAPPAATPPQAIRRPPPSEASASSRSRVPWMRYNDLPKRTPPRAENVEKRGDARNEPRGEAHAELRLADMAGQSADDEPLLTAEELNALLGEVAASGDETQPSPPRAWP